MNADLDSRASHSSGEAKTSRRSRSLSQGLVDLAAMLKNKPETVFDVVIVGSGYGGSVAAQQLAGLGIAEVLAGASQTRPIRVCVLERGAEYLPGMFPSSFGELPGHVRYSTQGSGKVTGNLEGLFDIRLGDDVSALVANGLGGGSLINAGVMLKPDSASLATAFPKAVATALETTYLDAARELLLAAPLALTAPNLVVPGPLYADPGCPPALPLKFQRMSDLARAAPAANGQMAQDRLDTQAAEISVALASRGPTPFGVNLSACVACGDCMTGCNVGAKASLDTNLLAQASRDGVAIYTGASVLRLSRTEAAGPHDPAAGKRLWEVEVVHTSLALRRREASSLRIRARKVILSAGTLGSPEILLRSRTEKLVFSSSLGERFSCNGDNIAAIHKIGERANCAGDEYTALGKRKVGPTITNMVKVPADENQRGFWIQEFAVPAPLKRLFAELATTGHSLSQLQFSDRSAHGAEKGDGIDPCAIDDDAIDATLLVGLIGHDSAGGSLRLPSRPADASGAKQEGTVQIFWPDARNGQQLSAAYALFKARGEALFPGASVIANPMWRLLPGKLENLVSQPVGPVLTVHPLGGCAMGSTENPGVVDALGRVLNLRVFGDDDWQGSLAVLDGSIIGGSLGANPSLTISAVALRAVEHLCKEWGFLPAVGQKARLIERPLFSAPEPAISSAPATTEIKVMERLGGHVSLTLSPGKPEMFYVELTLAYQNVELRRIMSSWGGRTLKIESDASCIRIFRSGAQDEHSRRYPYDTLRYVDDSQRDLYALLKAPLAGHLRFLHREKSGWLTRVFRGFRSYLCNRGKRDIWQDLAESVKAFLGVSPHPLGKKKPGLFTRFMDAFRLASRAGEVRLFDYVVTVGAPEPLEHDDADDAADATHLRTAYQDREISGKKRLTYDRRANPWSQLTRLKLTHLPLLEKRGNDVLELDASYMVKQGVPLFQLTRQRNQAEALLDMASFALFMTRVLLNIHLWTFRKPDRSGKLRPERMPADIAGLPPAQVTDLTVGLHRPSKTPAVVRLTRYPRPAAAIDLRRAKHGESPGEALAPLVMIHGYSVSGTTFTHPSLKKSAAEYFWKQGRDVWIVDLRTSTGFATASLPWSIEEVALVDIPAALLHIKNATGQRADVIAHCIGAAMMGMALLTDARDIAASRVQLGVDTRIKKAQLGTLMAFNGAGGGGQPHPTVRSIVLSQKGPLLRYSEANVFRAYLLRSLRRWLVPDGYRFEPLDEPKVSDQLLDRLLSSLPYPDPDYDVENPPWPWQTTPWTATRHRMDALYGRDFAAGNLNDRTLRAINDLFGPINLNTVAETLNFVDFNCITNQRGRGEFVTLDNLYKRWGGIPTLAIHGAGNGLVDVSTQTLLEENFGAAGVPFKKITFPKLEHQDVWIGIRSHKVFAKIERFLKVPPCASVLPAGKPDWRFDAPWIGPRLRKCNGGVEVLALSSPRYGNACLILVPVKKIGNAPSGDRYAQSSRILVSTMGDSRNWLKLAANADQIRGNGSQTGWLAVMAHTLGQTTLTEWNFRFDRTRLARRQADSSLDQQNPTPEDLQTALSKWLTLDADFETCFMSQQCLARLCAQVPPSFSFGLGSCQFPANLVDKTLARESLTQLAALAELADGKRDKALDFVIFAGDQIYADATGGLADPVRSDERYDLPYEVALRASPMRRIMRCVPAYMMLDDHEIIDNWEPAWKTDKSAARLKRLRKQGVQAYWKYQRMDDERARSPDVLSGSLSLTFDHGCASFYLLDTRSKREYRAPGDPDADSMFSPEEMMNLKNWLQKNPEQVKFVVSSSIILPRRLGMLNQGASGVAESDGWEGYPGNLRDLFEFIVAEEVQNVVFLSGDEHLCCVASATLALPGKPDVKLASIHASGLYAPFPFANARQQDFADEFDEFPIGCVQCSAMAQFVPEGNNFALIKVASGGSKPRVSAEFRVAGEWLRSDDVFSGNRLCRSAAFPAPPPGKPLPCDFSLPAAPVPPSHAT